MLMCDTEFDDKAFFERGVRLVKFCKPSDSEAEVIGCEMRRRAKKLNANFSQECAMMLLEMPELIPKSWRKRKIVFSGTMWKDENYDRVPYLVWRGEKHGWQLDFGYSAGMWDGSFRLLAFRS